MQQDTSADAISRGPAPGESKGESDANAVTLEHLEDEPAPHLHIKTFLIVAVSGFECQNYGLLSCFCTWKLTRVARPCPLSPLPS